jgi:hypothetical protein
VFLIGSPLSSCWSIDRDRARVTHFRFFFENRSFSLDRRQGGGREAEDRELVVGISAAGPHERALDRPDDVVVVLSPPTAGAPGASAIEACASIEDVACSGPKEVTMQPSSRVVVLAAAALVVAFAVGCRAHLTDYMIPEYNLTASSTQLSDQQMGEAVRLGCVAAGWNVLEENPGQTLAQVVAGRDNATVAISYSGSHFRIEHYESTPGVGFDGTVVHHRYKFWVDRLFRHIRDEVDRLHGAGTSTTTAPAAEPAPTEPDAGPAAAPEAAPTE